MSISEIGGSRLLDSPVNKNDNQVNANYLGLNKCERGGDDLHEQSVLGSQHLSHQLSKSAPKSINLHDNGHSLMTSGLLL